MSIVFFDLEASSLVEGFPIEVGWAWIENGEVRSEGHLVRPTPFWSESKRWDPAAERLHGISLERLQAEGKTCHEVVAQMNDVLASQVLISDNPEYDGRWLGQVFEIAGAAPTFEISDISADALIASAADKFGILDLEYTWVERETARLSPRTHRAAADAAYWATFFGLLQLGQEELVRRRVAAGESGVDFGPARWQPR